MNSILLAFFQLWARQMGCLDVTLLPTQEIIHSPWLYRIESADVCGQIAQRIESVYLPHGGTLGSAELLNGDRVYNAPSIFVIRENMTPVPSAE